MTQHAPLDHDAIRTAIQGGPWRAVDVVDRTGSTNADLLARAAAGEDVDGAVLLAEQQTAGRGRNGRQWISPPRTQLAMSLGVRASGVPIDGWGWLPLIAGMAVVDAVARTTSTTVRLKWPNDVIADGAKLAGLLAEVTRDATTIVLGIGINVSVTDFDFETANSLPPTSLALLGVVDPDRTALLLAVLDALGERIDAWRTEGGAAAGTVDAYRARSATIGSRVRAVLPGDREVLGTARDVDAGGRLLVDDGHEVVPISAGDVIHVRAAGG